MKLIDSAIVLGGFFSLSSVLFGCGDYATFATSGCALENGQVVSDFSWVEGGQEFTSSQDQVCAIGDRCWSGNLFGTCVQQTPAPASVPEWCQPTVFALESVGINCSPQQYNVCPKDQAHPFTLSCSENPVGVIVNTGYVPSPGTVGDFLWCCQSVVLP